MFTEYVGLRGSSWHEDCQCTLMKCRDKLCSKEEIELRVLPEPDNVRDKNALIIQAKVNDQWDRIGYIPKEQVRKFTVAIRNNEVKIIKFKNIKCRVLISDAATQVYIPSVLVTKTGKWLPRDNLYMYNGDI